MSPIGADDAFLDEQDEGFGVIQGGVDVGVGTQRSALDPADVYAEIGALAQHEICAETSVSWRRWSCPLQL